MKEDSSLPMKAGPQVQDGTRADEHSDAIDAARWRALMSSQRIRVMGSAGFVYEDNRAYPRHADSYLHMGVELWNKHEAAHPSAEYPQDLCREQLIAYVDHIRASTSAPAVATEEQGSTRSGEEHLSPLRDRIAVLEEALRPFANIKLSSIYADGENEGYTAFLDHSPHPDFKRADILKARAALSNQGRL